MPFSIQFPDTGNIVEFRIRGRLSFDLFRRLHEGLYLAPEWRTGMNCIGIMEAGTDLSDIDAGVLKRDFKAELDRLKKLIGPDFRMAWVVADDHNLPIVRLWQAMPFVASSYELRIYREAADARAWLGQYALAV